MKRTGITLIGMPGSGKSTIGKLLSKRLSFRFIDLDLFIKEKGGESHDTIANVQGESALLGLEEKYALALDLDRAVFSPGGSIIYSKKAMEKLRKETAVFYLELPIEEIERRLGDGVYERGIVGIKEKGLSGLFRERTPLCAAYAHHAIVCRGLRENEIVSRIADLFDSSAQ